MSDNCEAKAEAADPKRHQETEEIIVPSIHRNRNKQQIQHDWSRISIIGPIEIPQHKIERVEA